MKIFFIHFLSVSINMMEVFIDNPYASLYKNTNVQVFYLILGIKETRFLVQDESCVSKCGLNESVCDSKKKWNHDEVSLSVRIK